ncbi:MAG: DHH family phosphoesterase [Patescibacteria group bacterium]
MPLNEIEQAKNIINKSDNILIVFRKNYTVDSIASALALYSVLKKQNKNVTVASHNFTVTPEMAFLPGIENISGQIKNLRKFIISLNLKNAGVEEFSYDVNDEQLKIFITPKGGFFEEKDLTTGASDFVFDLIITVDTTDIESLGSIYDNNLELFYNVALINFCHSPKNESFGQINLVNIKALSTTQVIYNFIKTNFNKDIDYKIATLILAGIMSKTQAFKTSNITPEILQIVSELIAIGANREEIVKNLYQSKSLSTLKLWGHVLSNIKQDKSIKLVYSSISHEDFIKSDANIKDVRGAVEEIITSVPDSEIVLILYEKPTTSQNAKIKICGQIFTKPNYDSKDLIRKFNPEGSKDFAEFEIENSNLLESEKIIIDEIRKNA